MIQKEIRNAAMYCEDAQPEVRQEGDIRRIRGYAVKFNSRSSPIMGFREVIYTRRIPFIHCCQTEFPDHVP